MKGLVLVGGLGTRLMPLTETVPKPLVTLLNRPLIDYIITSVPEDMEMGFTLSYGSEAIREYLASRPDSHRFIFIDEPEPLGTGGAIRNASEFLDEPFMVFNSDIISELDTARMMEFHSMKGGIGTIALYEVDEVSRYGVAKLHGDRITKFVEKPVGSEAPSKWINAGVYILEPEVLDLIPEGKASIEKEVFPLAVDKRMFGFRFEGYWTDVGTLPSYLSAMKILLKRMVDAGDLDDMVLIADDAVVESDIEAPAVIGPGVRIEPDCMIGNCAIMDNVVVGRGSVVHGAIIAPGTVMKPESLATACILGKSGKKA